jgi:serine/threonine protein kinase
MLTPNAWLQSRYQITRQLGTGGMGTVYLAKDHRLAGYQCAIKEMSPSQLSPQDRSWATRAFQQEAQMLAKLNHAGLVRVSDYFEEGGNWYLVMDYVPGQTLETWLEQTPGGFLPLHITLNYVEQLCDVLDYLHHQQPPVVFRDLKPGNVMVTPSGDLKLIDFGIARLFKPGQTHNTVNLGTPGYASPEHGGQGQTDPRSDIYSLGVMLHQMVTGYDPTATPFTLPPARSLNPTVPSEIETVIQRATQLNRSQRFQSAAEFREALLSPTQSGASKVGPGGTQVIGGGRNGTGISGSQRPTQPRKWWPVFAVLGIALIGVFLASRLIPPASPTPTPPNVTAPVRLPTDTPLATLAPIAPPAVPAAATSRPTVGPAPLGTPRQVVFSRGDVGCSEVVVLDLETGTETSFHGSDNTNEPTWSPDGHQFVASAGACPNKDSSLLVFTPDTDQSVHIVSSGNNIDPDWGSDNRVYFARGTTSSNDDIYSVRPDGSDERWTGLSGRQPVLSPDGRYLAYMQQVNGGWRIFVAENAGDGRFVNSRQLTLPSVAQGAHGRMPHWTSDSARVVFNITNKNFETVAISTIDVASGRTTTWQGLSPNGQLFARPSCGADSWCVANEIAGGVWLLRENNGDFSVDRQLTTNVQDWSADLYP